MFRNLAWVGAQDETFVARFRSLGVPADRIEVTSSLKWDTAAVTGRVDGADALAAALGLDGSRPVWVCGSTGPGEEEMILDALHALQPSMTPEASERTSSKFKVQSSKTVEHDAPVPPPFRTSNFELPTSAGPVACAPGSDSNAPVLVLVPRKPERFDEVATVIADAGFACVRRSQRPDGTRVATYSERSVVLGDTMGELRKFYSLADVVFVGRSLVPLGGSDPMEVAALGKAILFGPHMENFESPVSLLQAVGAIRRVQNTGALATVIGELLGDATTRKRMGAAARAVVLEHQGATQRTVDQLVRLMAEAGRPGSGHSGAIPL
jgi:3-deoxy-D-manno-octulosonic-acid transferase